jgi:phage/plasmid-associated DNA primase
MLRNFIETSEPVYERTMEIIFDDDNNVTININNTITRTINNGTINNMTNGRIKNRIKNYDVNAEDYAIDSLIDDNEIFNNEIFINDSNLELVKYFKDDEFRKLYVESLKHTSCDIARVLWYVNKEKYTFHNKKWYVFDHIWKPLENCSQTHIKIYTELVEYYNKLADYFEKQNNKNDKNKRKHLKKLINSFKHAQQRNEVLSEAEKLFMFKNKNFENKLNTNLKLLGFNNGVFDFDKLEFREGCFDDYISMSVGYDYVPTKSAYFDELMQFLKNIQPDAIDRDYFLTLLSLPLIGEVSQELFHVFSCVDTTGMNKLIDLIKLTFGDYFEMITSTTLAKKQSIRRTDLLVIKNKRIVIASKPEPNQKLNSSVIKQLTDNDSTITVFIGNDIVQLNPQLNLILLHDNIPVFDNNNTRLWNRTRCINFPKKIINNSKSENILDYWKNDFVLLLIEYYIKIAKVSRLRPTKNTVVFGDVD